MGDCNPHGCMHTEVLNPGAVEWPTEPGSILCSGGVFRASPRPPGTLALESSRPGARIVVPDAQLTCVGICVINRVAVCVLYSIVSSGVLCTL